MNKKALQTLEYNKIIDLLAGYASTDGGRALCTSLQPFGNISEIEEALSATEAALLRSYKNGSLSLSGAYDLKDAWKRLEIGGSLNTTELLRVAKLLAVTKRAKSYSRGSRDEEITDVLTPLFAGLEPLTNLADDINRCIISEDEIADDASATLKDLRRQERVVNDRIKTQLTSLLNSSMRSYLQEAVITMRGDRYCLPVKAEYKGQVPGLIHDQSSTGSTFFIEPNSIVKLNNDLKELFLKEEAEIEKILAELSEAVACHTVELQQNYAILIELDFIFAKARLAENLHASKPLFNEDHRINIRKGRHPLLDKHKVVPIDLPIGENYSQLILTGPNTGGKTVSLKTLGLFTLMGQSGLFIPAADRSELCVFKQVYADIGDEQSIEQSLSTFSSHMKNIVYILKHADANCLVLFDELCAGTDPSEGAALAISILNNLQNRGAITMATTHYSELKVYALSALGVENACCEFDVETLSPTYRLLIGIPGKSNAFAISKKLGLKDSIIEDARARMDEEQESFEDLLSELETSRVRTEDDRLEAERLKVEAEKLQQRLDEKLAGTKAQKEKILDEAREEARRIIKEAKDIADESIRAVQKYGNEGGAIKKMEEERAKLRKKMEESQKKTTLAKPEQQHEYEPPKNLKIGDTVKVMSMNMKGTVHTLPDKKGMLEVQMGILKYKVKSTDILLMPDNDTSSKKYGSASKKGSTGSVKLSKSASTSTEINLLGRNADDAIAELDKYLDDAYLAHIPSVRVVHGKGTGVLRSAVHNYLKRQPHVKSYRLGELGEGDAGVTIVEFN